MVHSLHKKNQEVEFLRNESDLAILTNEELIYFISSSKGNPNFINRPVVPKKESLIFLLYSENNTICLNNREFLENSRVLYKSPFVILPGVYWRTSLLISSFLTTITMEFNVMWLLMAVFLGCISHGKNRLSCVVVKRSSRMREIGVRLPIGHTCMKVVETGIDSFTAKRSCVYCGSAEMTIIRGRSVSQ